MGSEPVSVACSMCTKVPRRIVQSTPIGPYLQGWFFIIEKKYAKKKENKSTHFLPLRRDSYTKTEHHQTEGGVIPDITRVKEIAKPIKYTKHTDGQDRWSADAGPGEPRVSICGGR
jgi:hypothetical protein